MGNRADAEKMTDKELVEALQDIEDDRLTGRSLDFVDEQGRKLAKQGHVWLSPTQRKWAEDIWERYGE